MVSPFVFPREFQFNISLINSIGLIFLTHFQGCRLGKRAWFRSSCIGIVNHGFRLCFSWSTLALRKDSELLKETLCIISGRPSLTRADIAIYEKREKVYTFPFLKSSQRYRIHIVYCGYSVHTQCSSYVILLLPVKTKYSLIILTLIGRPSPFTEGDELPLGPPPGLLPWNTTHTRSSTV